MTTEAFSYSYHSGNTSKWFNDSLNETITTITPPPPPPPPEGMTQYVLYDVTININEYYLWVVLAFGFPGNALSLLTILRMPSVSSSKMHVALLAVVDNCAIVSKLLYHQLSKHHVSLGHGGCKVIMFLGNFFSILAGWILVAMTLERFIAVWFPLKVNRIYSKRKATIVLVTIIVLTFAFNSIFFAAMQEDAEMLLCTYTDALFSFMLNYWYWADALAYAIIPCVIILVSNTLIIVNVQMSTRRQRRLTNNFDPKSRRVRDQQQITTMLIVISIVFLLLMLPNSVFYLVSETWKESTAPDSYARLEFHFTKQLVHMLSDFNHAVNFYLYFLSMATFRHRFLDTLLCRKPARKPKGSNSSVFKTSHSYVSFQSTHSANTNKPRTDDPQGHSLTNLSDVSSEV
ncbi:hypothetical protein ACOMHN_043671 [Nucella lapillus]